MTDTHSTSGSQAQAELQADNDRVRVTRWRFAPGAETGFHVHGMDYVIVPLTTGPVELTGPDGTVTQAEMVAGQSYFRQKGVAHNVRYVGTVDFSFVEVELKDAPAGA